MDETVQHGENNNNNNGGGGNLLFYQEREDAKPLSLPSPLLEKKLPLISKIHSLAINIYR